MKCIIKLFFAIFMICAVSVSADESVKIILEKYDSETLNEEQAIEIVDAFREADLRPGPELDELIRAEGFDPEEFKKSAPPPPKGDRPEDSSLGNHPPKMKSSGIIYSSLSADYGTSNFEINSKAINNGELLDTYKCEEKIDGIENSIPLNWNNIPSDTKSLAIIMYHHPNPEDKKQTSTYLLLWGIDPSVKEIAYGEAANGNWFMGQNKDGNVISYTSPCSPSAGTHEYTIAIFALAEETITLPQESSLEINFDKFMTAIEEVEILGRADIVFKDVRE